MDKSFYRVMADVENRHWWFVARRSILADVLAARPWGEDDLILDIGCGTGGNLPMLQKYASTVGIELDSSSAQLAGKQGPVVTGGDTTHWPIARQSADLLTAFDVLEHVPDHQQAMTNYFATLKPGGQLLLTVPAFQWMWSSHDDLSHHQRRYVASDLEKLAREAGFEIDYLSYHNTLLFPLSVLMRALSRLTRGKQWVDELRVPPAPLNGLLQTIYAAERYFVRRRWRLPFGLSLIAILNKPTGS